MYAATDIVSHISGKLYAPQGAIVEVIKIVDNVAFCSYEGKKFPCHISKLTYEYTPAKQQQPLAAPKPKRRR